MRQKWDFVPPRSTDGSISDAESKKFVRRRAMKEFRERQRLDRTRVLPREKEDMTRSDTKLRGQAIHKSDIAPNISKHPAFSIQKPAANFSTLQELAPLIDNGHQKESSSGEELVNQESTQTLITALQLRACSLRLSLDTFDPLAKYGLASNTTQRVLFDHFVSVITPALYPLGVNRNKNPLLLAWTHRALTEPAVLEATLFHSSVHLDQLHKRNWSIATRCHRGKLIRQVNRLMKSPGQEASDAAIAAVGMLAGTGNVTGDFTEPQIHMKALKRMVNLRGGLRSLGADGLMEIYLSTLDLICATLNMSKPCFDWRRPDIPSSSSSDSSGSTLKPYQFEADLRSVFRDMSDLSSNFASLSSPFGITRAEFVSFHRKRAFLEQRLLCLPVASANRPEDELEAHVFNACRISGLICANYLFRDLFPSLSVFIRLNRDLGEIVRLMESVEEQIFRTSSKELLLWVYFVGGMISCHKERYAVKISRTMESLDLVTWEDIETVLERHVFPAKMHDRNCLSLWHKIQTQHSLLTEEL